MNNLLGGQKPAGSVQAVMPLSGRHSLNGSDDRHLGTAGRAGPRLSAGCDQSRFGMPRVLRVSVVIKRLLGPCSILPEECVGEDDELTHDGGDGDLGMLSYGGQSVVDFF